MSTTLSTTAKELGRINVVEGSQSPDGYYFKVYAYYTKGTNGKATIYAKIQLNTSSATCDGTLSVQVGTQTAEDKDWNNQYSVVSNGIEVTYPNSGVFGDKTIKVTLSNMRDGKWADGTHFGCEPKPNQNPFEATITLPDIDAVPVINSLTYAIQSKGYTSSRVSSAVAGKSKYRITINGVKYARSISYTWSGAGTEDSGTVKVSYSSTATNKTFDIECPAYTSNYRLKISVTVTNDRTSATSSLTGDNRPYVYGYTIPVYDASSTTTTRCDSSGNASAHGTYGKLHLTWKIQDIPNNQLKTPTVQVTINGTTRTLSSTGGSIANGYLDYLFNNLPINYEAKFNIVLTDEIDTNTITTLGIVKAIVPLSLYQNNNLIGIAIGAMATSKGFYIYNSTDIPVYVKRKNDSVVREVYIDTNDVLHIGSKQLSYTSGSSL